MWKNKARARQRKTKVEKTESAKGEIGKGQYWGIISFSKETGYIVSQFYNNQEESEKLADELTTKHSINGIGYQAVPVHIAGTYPIIYVKKQIPQYSADTDYYVTMRSTFGGGTEHRALALWPTKKEAVAFCGLSELMKDPKLVYTFIGGPVHL